VESSVSQLFGTNIKFNNLTQMTILLSFLLVAATLAVNLSIWGAAETKDDLKKNKTSF